MNFDGVDIQNLTEQEFIEFFGDTIEIAWWTSYGMECRCNGDKAYCCMNGFSTALCPTGTHHSSEDYNCK